MTKQKVAIALPTGVLLPGALRILARSGVVRLSAAELGRKLLVERPAVKVILVRPADVAAYVDHGAADLGIVGKDVLWESHGAHYELADLHFGGCRLVLAVPATSKLAGRETWPPLLRVATGAEVQLAAAEGRFRAIDSLRRAGAFTDISGFERVIDRMMIATAIAGAGDEALARASAATLARDFPPDSATAWLDKRPVWMEGWLVGAYHAMYGDTVLARRWAGALGALPEGGSPRQYGAALRADVEARLAARRGDRPTALAHAYRAFELWDIHTENQQELLPEPAMRFHLAALLRASNRPDSAAGLFRSLVPPTTWMGFYTARASLELAEIEEARGDRADALRHILTAMRLWEHGDSAVSSLRDRARRVAERQR